MPPYLWNRVLSPLIAVGAVLLALVSQAVVAAPTSPEAEPGSRLLSTRSVQIHYEVDQRGAADLEDYLLFYTRNGGQSCTEDSARHRGLSPYVFKAPADGRFGFLLITRDQVGLGDSTPQPGSKPTLEVVIDTTPPTVSILQPRGENRVSTALPLDVQWKVEDPHLDEDPVEVAYSLDDGPWIPIWKEAPALSKRQWVVPFTRGHLRLRIRARDLAGNMVERFTENPLTLFPPEITTLDFLIVPPHSVRLTVPVYYRIRKEDGQAMSPDELRGVRLWYRQGAGDWQDGGLDLDRDSPSLLQVDRDGFYHIILVAEDPQRQIYPDGAEYSLTRAPRPDADAHGSVMIDTLEPRLQILEPANGSQLVSDSILKIKFLIEEENPLREQPQVRFSLDLGSNWSRLPVEFELEPIEGTQQSIGRATIRIPDVESNGFLVAIEVRDLVGNRGQTRTSPADPIVIRRLGADPKAKVEEIYREALVRYSQPEIENKREALPLFRQAPNVWEPVAMLHHDYAVALETTEDSVDSQTEALRHYRRALELEPTNLPMRFSLIRYLLTRSRETGADEQSRESLRTEALKQFEQIDFQELLFPTKNQSDRIQAAKMRKQFSKWKEEVFTTADLTPNPAGDTQ
jgi:hypothetical protein